MHKIPKGSLGLAPMEGVSDFPVRLWFYMAAAPAFLSTPFLRVTETYPEKLPRLYAPELFELRSYLPYLLIPQLMAARPADFLRAAFLVLRGQSFVDLNCGCPSPKVFGHGAGSSLLETPGRFGDFVATLARELGPCSLSVKMRLGIADSGEFPALFDAIRSISLHHLSIHGRTREQRYLGTADWRPLRLAAETARFPIIGSGDISVREFAKDLPPIEAAMVGRGALRNPWLFQGGHPSALSPRALRLCLATWAVLNWTSVQNEPLLIELVKRGLCSRILGTDEEAWQTSYNFVCQAVFATEVAPRDLELPLPNLGRTKMLWLHLRESLPTAYQDPALLRARNYCDFFDGLDRVSST